MSKNFFIAACVIFSLIISPEVNATEWDHDDNIEKAVILCKKNTDKSGRNNLRKLVSNCYVNSRKGKNPQKFEFCAALDLCAYYLNVNMENVGAKGQEYFTLDSVSKRVSDGLASFGLSKEQIGDALPYIADTTGKWFKAHFSKETESKEIAVLNQRDIALIIKGSDALYPIYMEKGISAAAIESKRIIGVYDREIKSNRTKKYERLLFLTGFEISANLLDQMASVPKGIKGYEYFSDPEVNGRLKERFLKLGLTESKYIKLMDIAFPEVQKHLFERILK